MKKQKDSKVSDTIIRSLKKGIDEIIEGIGGDITPMSKVSEEKATISAQESGIVAAKNLIFKLYKHSESEGINNTKWIVSKITKLINSADKPISVLTSALNSSITDMDPESMNIDTFYKNKSAAGEKLFEVLSAIRQLEDLLEKQDGDNFVIEEESEFAQTHCEVYAEIEARRKTKAGYNKEHDCIVIDPDGTIGEIREVYGLRIALPEPPPLKQFWNSDVYKEGKQFWQRKPLPRGLSIETQDNYKDFIAEEFERKRKGVWFFNNGKQEYITGAQWFLLQHGKTDADGDENHEHGYFHFRSAHRDIFYFMEAVWVDPRCLGMVYEKTRRTGATYCLVGFKICKSITSLTSNFGLTSKTGDDGEAIFNIMVVPMFQGLPFYFKPNRLADNPKEKYEFKQPSQKRGKAQRGKEHRDYSLNSTISFRNTTNDAYDQYALKMYLGDEFSKWKKPADILKHWRMISRAMTKGRKYTGKAYLISTIENVHGLKYDDPKAGSGDRYKHLYYQSDPKERNANDHTASGLYKLFIPCYDNFEGFIDKYGYPVKNTPLTPIEGVDGEMITTGILEYLEAEASKLQTQSEIYDFWRLNPRTEEEGFKVAAEDCMYDVKLLDTQISYNEQKLPEQLYTRGNFEPEEGCKIEDPFSLRVKWVPNERGKWLVSWLPDPAFRNKKIIKNGKIYPFNNDMGAFGADPFRVVQTVRRDGSNGSIHGLSSFNNIKSPYGKFFAEYIYRPEDPDTYTRDLIYACVYYGMPVLVETNVPGTVKSMKDWGYSGYSLRRPDKHQSKYTKDDKLYGGMPSSTGNIDDLANVVGWYIKLFVGSEEYIDCMPFNRTLIDWMQFRKENRTKHDAHVSSSLAIFANREDKALKAPKEEYNDQRAMSQDLYKLLSSNGIF